MHKKYVFEKILQNWELPDTTIKDRELFYKKLIDEQYDLTLENIEYLYKNLLPWTDKQNQKIQEILTWYNNNSFHLFSLYIFCLLAVCAVKKLYLNTCNNKEDILLVLLQAVSCTINMKEYNKIRDIFLKECNKLLMNKLPVKQLIFHMLAVLKQKSKHIDSVQPYKHWGFAMVFETMCFLAGIPRETAPVKHKVSVNTLLVYTSGTGKTERGITATLLLEAFPGRFGELYPLPDIIRNCRLGDTFLDSSANIIAYLKNEPGLWPGNCDICWQLIPDNREITFDNKILVGRSLEAAFIIGILKLFALIDFCEEELLLRNELKELNLKLVAITATVDRKGRLGKVGGIWQKLLEASRVKIGYVIISHDQNITETSKLVIIRAKDIRQAIKELHKEIKPERIIEKIKKFLLKYATETKELENRCNDAFEGEDLTNIKSAVRFHDKPRVYVEDLIEICLHYKTIHNKHPISILLEGIVKNTPFQEQDEINELRISFNKSLSNKKQKDLDEETTASTEPAPALLEKRVTIKQINMEQLKRIIPPLSKKGNPYVNRAMIPHPDLFFGRKKEIKWLKKRICTASPQSISLLGERRIGKSSLLNHLTFLEGDPGFLDDPGKYIFIYMDCQGLRSIDEPQLVTIIFTELKKKLKDSIELSLKDDFDDLRFLCEEITAKGLKLILLFDEFESITKNNHFTPSFYSLLRSLANNYAIALITSSVKNLKDMCASREISDSPFFNIFTIHHMGPLARNEAEELITKPSFEYGIPLDGLQDRIISESGLHPFFLQIMCCSWFDFLETSNLPVQSFINKKTPKEVLYQFREEARQHFEFIYETMQEKEHKVMQDILRGNAVKPDLYEVELLEQKGYVVRREDETLKFFCSEFERFVSQYDI